MFLLKPLPLFSALSPLFLLFFLHVLEDFNEVDFIIA